jgi:hypothetical protein
MSDLYSALDPLVEAFLALSQAGVNDLLASLWDSSDDRSIAPIVATANHPITPQQLSAGQLPLLSAYRSTEVRTETTMGHINDRVVTLEITYVAPETPPDDMTARWPLLQAVWSALLTSVCNGSDAYVGPSLPDSGLIEIRLETARKLERYLQRESVNAPGVIYPAFVARINVVERPVVDISHLAQFLSLRTKLYTDGLHPEPADVTVDTYTPEGEAVRDAVEPFDEESN